MSSSRRPIRPEDCYRVRTISDPRISPEGRWVACVISRPDRKNDTALSDIWLISADGRKRSQLTSRHHRDSSPRWSPDGSRIAFLGPAADDVHNKPQIWVIATDGGEAKQITHLKQGVCDPAWSPDGKRIAFLARDVGPQDRERSTKNPRIEVRQGRIYASDVKVVDRLRYRSAAMPPKEEQRHIYIVAASGGRPRKITDGDCDDTAPAWSPDGKQIAFVSNRGRNPDWDIVNDIWIVPAAGGQPLRLSALEGGASGPAWSPDGRMIAYAGVLDSKVPVRTYRILVQPAAGGEPISLTDSFDEVPHSPRWSADGSAVYFQSFDEGFHPIRKAPLAGEVARVVPKQRSVEAYSVSARTGAIAYLHSTPHHPADLFVCGADGAAERRLTDENRALVQRLQLGTAEPFWCRSSGGTRVQGWIAKPPGFRCGRRYPLVLMVHGGPHAAYLENWNLHAQALASRGYVVVYSNPRGSRGYGIDFMNSVTGNWGVDDAKDLLAVLNHVAKQGFVDRRRLGVIGQSYGGFMATWLLGTTRRFRAGVVECAATDRRMWYYSGDVHLWCEQDLGGAPWERPDDYRRVSSTTHAHKITAPLLLLHAEDDSRVPISSSEIVYTTVRRMGVESQFVRYPLGEHGFSRSSARFLCDSLNRAVDWFDRHLKAS